MRQARILGLLFLACGVSLLLGCPDSLMQPLPPGGGQGSYSGEFTSEDSTTVLGTFNLSINTVGAISGSGLLGGQSIELTGLLTGNEVDAALLETLSGMSGHFTGVRTGTGYSGDFTLSRPAGEDDLTGYWDCAPSV
jgi:hypothetical protein